MLCRCSIAVVNIPHSIIILTKTFYCTFLEQVHNKHVNKRIEIHCITTAAYCKRLYGRLIIIEAEVEGEKLFFFFSWNVTCHWIIQWLSPNVPFTSVLKTFYFLALNVSSMLTIVQVNVYELSSALLSPFNSSFIHRTTLLINVPHLPWRQFLAAF